MKEGLIRLRENRIFNYLSPMIILVAVALVFGIWSGGKTLTVKNLNMVFNQSLVVGLVATGAIFVFSTGRISAAMGGSTAIACIIGAMMYLKTQSPVVMVIGCILGGIFIMMCAIWLSRLLRMDVMTLSIIMMTLLTALQEWVLDGGKTISLGYNEMKELQNMNLPIIIGVLFMILGVIVFEFSKFGRELKMIGSNEIVTRQSGINTNKCLKWAFILAGIGVGLGAAVILIRTATLSQQTANSVNMDVMLAIVLGGTAIRGGTGSKIFSGLWGALTVAILTNGLSMVGIDAVFIQAVRGIFFIIVIALTEKKSEVLS